MSDTEQLKAKIQQQLIESGEYDKISSQLNQRLAESGWLDNLRKIAAEQVSKEEEPNFTRLSQTLEPKALSMVPDDIKEETLLQIKKFLESIIEKEV